MPVNGKIAGRSLNEDELRTDLAEAPIIDANTRFKYSNHGFGLAGQVIEAITSAPYKEWIKREIVTPAGLTETEPDAPLAGDVPFARATAPNCRRDGASYPRR